MSRTSARQILAALALLALAGCTQLPAAGPSVMAIQNGSTVSEPDDGRYLTFALDEPLARIVGPWRPRTFAERFAIRSGPRGQPLGIGDTVKIRILEAGDNGLFANEQSRGADFEVQIDETGHVFVPYVGRVRAAGRPIERFRASIQEALNDKAIQPQVLVTVTGNQANAVVVVGDVNKPGRYPLNVGGTRLLDAVALAEGSKFPTYESMVTLKRGRQTGSILLEDLFLVPDNNVFLRPSDEILLAYSPQTYTLLGAVKDPREIKFESKTVTLAEAVGRGGGLDDLAADVSGIFLFRYEEPEVLKAARPDFVWTRPGKVPVVYRLSLGEPRGFFVARSMWIRDKDIVYVATAPSVEYLKFLDLVDRILSVGSGGTSIALDIKDLQRNR